MPLTDGENELLTALQAGGNSYQLENFDVLAAENVLSNLQKDEPKASFALNLYTQIKKIKLQNSTSGRNPKIEQATKILCANQQDLLALIKLFSGAFEFHMLHLNLLNPKNERASFNSYAGLFQNLKKTKNNSEKLINTVVSEQHSKKTDTEKYTDMKRLSLQYTENVWGERKQVVYNMLKAFITNKPDYAKFSRSMLAECIEPNTFENYNNEIVKAIKTIIDMMIDSKLKGTDQGRDALAGLHSKPTFQNPYIQNAGYSKSQYIKINEPKVKTSMGMRCVYQGKRGGKYVKMHGVFVSLRSLKL